MITNRRPDDTADDASKASERGDHREAERLYLMAAARAAQFTNQPTMQKNVGRWDKAAQRERRLAELTKGSGGGSGSTPTQKPLPDWASGSDGLTFADQPKARSPITGMQLHQLFTDDTSGRAWYDERDKGRWNDFAEKLSAKQPAAAIGAVWADAFKSAASDVQVRVARMVTLAERMIQANSTARGTGQDVPNVDLAELVLAFIREDMPRFMAYRSEGK